MRLRLFGGLFAAALLAFGLSTLPGCSALSTFNTLVPKDELGAAPVLAQRFKEGPRGMLDVYKPLAAKGPAPVVVFFYGGGWDDGRRQDYAWAGRALAAQGFLTLVPDYRLVPEVRFPAFLEDGAAAVAWARKNVAAYGGDPDRIVLMGHSAGAYNAVMLGLDRRYLDAAGVPQSAIRGVVGLAGPYDFYPFDVPATVNAFGQAPDPSQTQPVTFARADVPPLLLLHGEMDETVRLRNSLALQARVQAVGGQAEVKAYPGVDHREILLALSKPLRGEAPTLADASAFVAAKAEN